MTQTQDPKERTRIERYDPASIEPRWQARWDELELYRTNLDDTKNRYYLLTMYPYPSGDIHIGHWYIKTPTDAIARYQRMHGKNVFLPIGFDAFGLPAENAAIKQKINPRDWTMSNIANMRRQLRQMGATFDWSSEVVTCDPDYYKWNQWFFLQFLKAGLAYRQNSPVDFCPNDGTLAREQVEGVDRRCWRCGAKVEKRDLDQWYLRVTKYADELLDFSRDPVPGPGPDHADATGSGARRAARSSSSPRRPTTTPGGEAIRVFTTRPDTLFGATFMVLAPEHPLVDALTAPGARAEVEAYAERAGRRDRDRAAVDRSREDRRGHRRRRDQPGQRRADPDLHRRLRPGDVRHRRDHGRPGPRRARLRVRPASSGCPSGRSSRQPGRGPATALAEAYVAHADDEVLVNSGEFSGLPADEGGRRIVAVARGATARASRRSTYRLRDWLVSRQRYWGTPIPVIHCPTHGIVPVPEQDLPVLLPDTVDYAGVGVNPLTRDEAFLNVACPIDGEPAKRETDTMDTFMDSSWYWFRYLSPDRADVPIDHDRVETWTPVQQYTGGAEHAVMHQLYGREFTKMIRDLGLVRQNEPWKRVFNQGQILGADGERMSKSRGNVQDPDELVSKYGADTVRLFLMFMGPWDQGGPWSPTGIGGVHPLPEPRLGAGAGPALPGAGRSRRGHAARRPGRGRGARGAARRGAPHPARRHRRLRGRSTSTRWSRS